jgi:hypothetical protein
MDYMVDEPPPRSARRGFGLAAAMILTVAACHFNAVVVCYFAMKYESRNFTSFTILNMGSSGEPEGKSEAISWLGVLGLFVLSFPVGWFFCCSSIGDPKMLFAIMSVNSLFWGCIFYLRYYFVKHTT